MKTWKVHHLISKRVVGNWYRHKVAVNHTPCNVCETVARSANLGHLSVTQYRPS